MNQEPTYVGIDIANAEVVVAVHPTGRSWSVSYDEAGSQELVSRMITWNPPW